MHTPFKEIEYAEYSKKPILSPLAFPNPSDTYPGNFTDVDASTNINGSYANGGTVDLARFDLNESEQERIDNLITGLLRKAPKKPNVQQPFMDVEEGAGPGDGQGIDTGTNSVAGTIQGIMGLIGLVNAVSKETAVKSVIAAIKGETMAPPGNTRGEDLVANVNYTAPTTNQDRNPENEEQPEDIDKFSDPQAFGLSGPWSDLDVENVANATAAAGKEVDHEDMMSEMGVSAGASTGSAATDGNDASGQLESGGIIGHANGEQVAPQQQAPQEAIDPSTADTTMDTAGMGPMGLVDDMRGDDTTGVEDDLNMDTEEGAYVLNADSVELIGLRDLNDMVKEAIAVAIGSDIPLPKKIDPTKKVPIKISNGEFVIPAILVPIIGLENLEKMNKRGLAYREKNEEAQAAQEAPQGPQAGPAGPQAPQGPPPTAPEGVINLKRGGSVQQMNHLLQR